MTAFNVPYLYDIQHDLIETNEWHMMADFLPNSGSSIYFGLFDFII